MENLKQLDNDSNPTLYYNGSSKDKMHVNCKVHVLIPDQPECRSINGLLSGGHGYHGRFGWSFDVKKQDMMCPCADCIHGMQQKILDDEFIMNSCNNCYNFWWNPQKMINILDDDYPIEGDQQCLKLTYDLLKKLLPHVTKK